MSEVLVSLAALSTRRLKTANAGSPSGPDKLAFVQFPARYSERLEAKRAVVVQLQHKLAKCGDDLPMKQQWATPVIIRCGLAASMILVVSACAGTDSGNQSSDGQARVCSSAHYSLDAYGGRQGSPAMTVSSDGYCTAGFRAGGGVASRMALRSPPAHGEVTILGSPGPYPKWRYQPTAGYVGSDRFEVLTGQTMDVMLRIDVTVVN